MTEFAIALLAAVGVFAVVDAIGRLWFTAEPPPVPPLRWENHSPESFGLPAHDDEFNMGVAEPDPPPHAPELEDDDWEFEGGDWWNREPELAEPPASEFKRHRIRDLLADLDDETWTSPDGPPSA